MYVSSFMYLNLPSVHNLPKVTINLNIDNLSNMKKVYWPV